MRADEKRFADRRVQSAVLQLDNKITTDEAAQAFVEQTIAQFQKGKWKRYADPEWHVLLTGRSSLLTENEELDTSGTGAPDPNYKMTTSEWSKLSRALYFRWVGDGIVAKMSVNHSPGVDGKPAYRMSLDFDLLDVMLKRDAENEATRLKEGDAKGWNSTAEHEAAKATRAKEIKRLIANAIKRGDSVLQPAQ